MGIIVGLITGIDYIFMKLGLSSTSSPSPVAAAFISFAAATVVSSAFLCNENKRTTLFNMKREGVRLYFISGMFGSVGHLMRYVALSLGPASVVAPIVSTSPIFVLLFSFLLNRKLEVFSLNVIIGIIAVVVGAILLV